MLRQGRTARWLAEQLSTDRTNIYKIFRKASIDTALLLRISAALGTDFFRLLSDDLNLPPRR